MPTLPRELRELRYEGEPLTPGQHCVLRRMPGVDRAGGRRDRGLPRRDLVTSPESLYPRCMVVRFGLLLTAVVLWVVYCGVVLYRPFI